MFAFERHDTIMELLNDKKQVTVPDLSEILNVSISTIRNDLTKLEKDGLLTKTHGGAILPKNDVISASFTDRLLKNTPEKEAIAEKALTYIQDGQCIILDASSTSLFLARKLHNFKRLIVITNSLYTAIELKDNQNINLILTGGLVTKNSYAIEGLLGQDLIKNIHADLCFISAKGFTINDGLTDFNIYECELKKMLVKKSKKVIALIDSSKLETTSTSKFASVEEINLLITDSNIKRNLIEKYTDNNLNISIGKY